MSLASIDGSNIGVALFRELVLKSYVILLFLLLLMSEDILNYGSIQNDYHSFKAIKTPDEAINIFYMIPLIYNIFLCENVFKQS